MAIDKMPLLYLCLGTLYVTHRATLDAILRREGQEKNSELTELKFWIYWEKSLSIPQSYKTEFPESNELIDENKENKIICPPKFMVWWHLHM